MRWDEMDWDEVRRNHMRWDEMKCEVCSVRNVKCEVWSVHVKRTIFAQNTCAQVWLTAKKKITPRQLPPRLVRSLRVLSNILGMIALNFAEIPFFNQESVWNDRGFCRLFNCCWWYELQGPNHHHFILFYHLMYFFDLSSRSHVLVEKWPPTLRVLPIVTIAWQVTLLRQSWHLSEAAAGVLPLRFWRVPPNSWENAGAAVPRWWRNHRCSKNSCPRLRRPISGKTIFF